MKVNAKGPLGALLALANVDTELHGVRARRVSSGRESSNVTGHGTTHQLLCYVDGRKSSRKVALERLSLSIGEGEAVAIEGPAYPLRSN